MVIGRCANSPFPFGVLPPSADALRLFPAAHFQLSSKDDTSAHIQLFHVLWASPFSPLPGAKSLSNHQEGGKNEASWVGQLVFMSLSLGFFFFFFLYCRILSWCIFGGGSYVISKSCFQSNKSHLFGCLKRVRCHHVWSHQGKKWIFH